MKTTQVKNLVIAALMLALCLVLPFLTGQVPQIGGMLCPMHLPVLLAGFLCGPWWALLVGLIAPILRHLLFGMPPLITAVAMCFELATYGLIAGLLYRALPKKTAYIYVSLVGAMLAGRVVWGVVMVLLTGLGKASFSWTIFLTNGFVNAIPGIILQLVLIPVLVLALKRARLVSAEQ